MKTVTVPLGDRSYPVIIGDGSSRLAADHLPQRVTRAAIVTQAGIPEIAALPIPTTTHHIGDGEAHKSLRTAERLCSEFALAGLHRSDIIVAVGGGLVTDIVGLAASLYHRGTPYLSVATTLLGQVDAAIGGKVAANLAEGKNLVGGFWQPRAVLCDTTMLETLPPREWTCGIGEMVKYAFLGSRVDLDMNLDPAIDLDERIRRCVECKARVVSRDEHDGRFRFILNYGHTLAHAIEIIEGFAIKHGEAVAIGIHFAARLAMHMERIDETRVGEHLDLLHAYDLSTTLPASCTPDEVIALMKRDKKSSGGLTFVLDGVNGVDVVDDVSEALVRETLEEMAS